MTEEEIYAQLTEIFHQAFGDHSIRLRPQTTASDIAGWDSVKMVSLIVATEQHFGIRMRSREIDRLKCVGDFVALVKAKQGAA
jgi:acyl carrier protein